MSAIELQKLPTVSEIVNDLIGIIVKRTKTSEPPLSAASTMEDAGIDSFDFVEMIFDVEDHFGIELDVNANKTDTAAGTVGDVAEMVLTGLRNKREG